MENIKDTNQNVEACYLALGSNIGNRFMHLSKALRAIENEIEEITKKSSIYESSPWGFQNQSHFLNMVIQISWNKNQVFDLLNRIHEIENKLGRVRNNNRYSPRTLDIDILSVGNLQLANTQLTLPHPRLYERKFVLVPWCEIAPNYKIPKSELSVEKALEICKDNGHIALFSQH